VEAIRTVPVVLRRGARHVRTVLTGLAADGELRRVVDGAYRSRRPEPGGLLLSTYQADRLGLAPGDLVRVEVTEGQRRVLDLRVTGVVAEVIGAGAYLELETLHRLMRESAVLSGAALRVEPGARRRLWTVLKRRPGVSSVAVRDVMRESFDRTVAESFRISLASIVGFACLIAAGVVYNGARISLSERAREVEQGSLTLAALPLGTLLGALLCWLMVHRFEAESFRLPFDLRPGTVAASGLVVLAAAAVSAWAVTRRAARTDLVEVLKVRE
jgi:putative ABC transport system permease protein